jgi:hypothetical protein
MLDNWERPLFWQAMDESVVAEPTSELTTNGKRAVKLQFDFAQSDQPMLLSQLNPPWDLTGVSALTVDVYRPDQVTNQVAVTLSLRAKETDFTGPATPLKRGWNTVNVDLNGAWLPPSVRGAAEQIRWSLASPNKAAKGWVAFDNMVAR